MYQRKEHFLPIEDYGVIGNLHTCALVSKQDASIDHFCFPNFDSPLLFGRLLSRKGGGYFQIAPLGDSTSWSSKQLYLPESNVLLTRFLGASGGIGQVTDFLPVISCKLEPQGNINSDTRHLSMDNEDFGNNFEVDCMSNSGVSSEANFGANYGGFRDPELKNKVKGWPWIVRKVETIRGSIKFRVDCQPAFNYGRDSHSLKLDSNNQVIFKSQNLSLILTALPNRCLEEKSSIQWSVIQELVNYREGFEVSLPKAVGEFELNEDQAIFFVLRCPNNDKEFPFLRCPRTMEKLFHDTNEFWHSWINKCTYKGRWREMVTRSALVLKLMTFAPTGAIIAAPTTSLPESLGGNMNWDYRFTWIRDAAFTVYAFLRIGLTEEAADFMKWIERRCADVAKDDPIGLRLMYDIWGRHPTIVKLENGHSTLATEIELDHWTGYKDSYPVRIGNMAALQQQLDIYGELIDAIYLCDKWVRPISFDFWLVIRDHIIPKVVKGWAEPDHGIWEVRAEPQHYVYSKVMAWVAMDRVVRLATKRSLPAPIDSWIKIRNQIHESIMESGYNEKKCSFTQYYGGEALDASNLVMPLVFFLPPDDPRFLGTLRATLLPPKLGGLTVNHLVFRQCCEQSSQDLEGTFGICSFWLIEALARAGQREPSLLKEARLMFEDVIGYANHVGLFSEEIGLGGSALGNFPQAFTHLSLISAAFNLDRVLP